MNIPEDYNNYWTEEKTKAFLEWVSASEESFTRIEADIHALVVSVVQIGVAIKAITDKLEALEVKSKNNYVSNN